MIKIGDKVKHKNPEIDEVKGIMQVFEIKNNYAICGYGDFERLGKGMDTYLLTDLEK